MGRKKKSTENEGFKILGLFDHVKHIREVQSEDYYTSLSDLDKKSFNKYMILRVLSMDSSIIQEISFVSKYINQLTEEALYKTCISIIPKSNHYCPYIKSKSQSKIQSELLELVKLRFQCSLTEARDYCKLLFGMKDGKSELVKLCESFGKTTKEIDKFLSYE